MITWNPWKGCRRCSEGCRYCMCQRSVKKKGVEELVFEKSKQYGAPLDKNKNGEYKIPGGKLVSVANNSDFFLPEADKWREGIWKIIRERKDLMFLVRTRRIERFYDCIPDDWQMGYDNVIVACAVEDQKTADERLPIFLELPIKHKAVLCAPLLELINIESYLDTIETVIAGGEAAKNARPLDFEWLPDIRWQCINTNTDFIFGRCGTHFLKDGRMYNMGVKEQTDHARKINIDYYSATGEHNLTTAQYG
ncbi:MAG: DUF5131 family protein [Lachnospiraceae bacterium]|nr:DUF5131 family protein [Lachnospiraceae bacterium]